MKACFLYVHFEYVADYTTLSISACINTLSSIAFTLIVKAQSFHRWNVEYKAKSDNVKFLHF